MLHTFLMIIHFFCAAAIVALVLLQRGKGAEAGAGFGAGASGTVFGARGASTALSRATAILAAMFMLTSLSLAYVGTHGSARPPAACSISCRSSSAPAHRRPGRCRRCRRAERSRRRRELRRPPPPDDAPASGAPAARRPPGHECAERARAQLEPRQCGARVRTPAITEPTWWNW